MPIGTSDGTQHQDELGVLIQQYWPEKYSEFVPRPGNVEDRQNDPPYKGKKGEPVATYEARDNLETLNEQTLLGAQAGVNDIDSKYVMNWYNSMRKARGIDDTQQLMEKMATIDLKKLEDKALKEMNDPISDYIQKLPPDDEIRKVYSNRFLGKWLFGEKEEPQVISGEKNAPYPTHEDVLSARQYEHGYGTGNESSRASIVNKKLTGLYTDEVIDAVKNTPTSDLSEKPDVASRIERAQIAVERNPLAKLGFDTSRIAIEPSQTKKTLGGLYSGKEDQAYVNFSESKGSTLVHESIHRGVKMLKEKSEEARKLMQGISEESLTRWIMNTEMGNPEEGSGIVGDKQIAQARADMINPSMQKKYERLMELAAEEVKNKRPGGPR